MTTIPTDLDRVVNQKMHFERQAWGQRLLARRRALGMTQEQISHKAGVSQQMISKIERAQKDPTDEVKVKICYVLGVQVNDIFSLPGIFTHTDDELKDNDHMARWKIGHRCVECDGPVVMAGVR